MKYQQPDKDKLPHSWEEMRRAVQTASQLYDILYDLPRIATPTGKVIELAIDDCIDIICNKAGRGEN